MNHEEAPPPRAEKQEKIENRVVVGAGSREREGWDSESWWVEPWKSGRVGKGGRMELLRFRRGGDRFLGHDQVTSSLNRSGMA